VEEFLDFLIKRGPKALKNLQKISAAHREL
jgi:hypothetical protein